MGILLIENAQMNARMTISHMIQQIGVSQNALKDILEMLIRKSAGQHQYNVHLGLEIAI